MRHAFLLLLTSALLFGCGDGADPNAGAADVPDWFTPSGSTDTTSTPPPSGNSNCKYDPAKLGAKIGDHVANISMKDAYGKTYKLHQTCGTSTKAIWVILAAGW